MFGIKILAYVCSLVGVKPSQEPEYSQWTLIDSDWSKHSETTGSCGGK
jgi:hypothetical protein